MLKLLWQRRSDMKRIFIVFFLFCSGMLALPTSAKVICGKKGTLKERIAQCQTTCSHKDHRWNLVAKLHDGFEAWYHEPTRTVWSDSSPYMANYFQANHICEYKMQFLEEELSDEVFWKLPTKKNWKAAYGHGFEYCAPRTKQAFWVKRSRSHGFRVIHGQHHKQFSPQNPRARHYFRCILKLDAPQI